MATQTPAFPGTSNTAPEPVEDSAAARKALGVTAEKPDRVVALYQKSCDISALATAGLPHGHLFPQGRAPGLYNKTLVGIPFVVCSDWVFRTAPARQGRNQMGEPVTYPAREVCQVYVQLVDVSEPDPKNWTVGEAELATLSGAYLCNQLRNLTHNDLVGAGIFTLAPNPQFSIPSGHPIMLKIWERGKDGMIDDIPF